MRLLIAGMSSAGSGKGAGVTISGVAKATLSATLASSHSVMLKKIFAKLRETIAPSRSSKPASHESSKPATAATHVSTQGGENRPERSHGGRGQGGGGGRSQPRDPREQREPRQGAGG